MSVNESRPLLRPVWQLINAAERRLCGQAVVASVSVAEGLALAGRRAARLLDPDAREPWPDDPRLAWVDHRTGTISDPIPAVYGQILFAKDAEQAIEQCLEAHLLAERIDKPVLCLIDEQLARSIRPVVLPPESPGPVRVWGVVPACAPFDELLLDAASWLDGISIAGSRISSDLLVVTLGADDDADRALDLLVVPELDALSGTALLERLAECATLLVRAGGEDPQDIWSRLSPDQRATIVRRRLRLGVIAPPNDDRSGLIGAIVAAAIGRDGVPPELARGAKAVALVDPTGLAEPRGDDSERKPGPPRMPAPGSGGRDDGLRQFHLVGHDETTPVFSADWTPAILRVSMGSEALADPGSAGLFEHWVERVLRVRQEHQDRRLAEISELIEAVGRTVGNADDLQHRLGQVGAEFVDPEALADQLSRVRGGQPVDRDLLDRLCVARDWRKQAPRAWILHDRSQSPAQLPGARLVQHADGLRAAIGLFDGIVGPVVDEARTLRRARLELEGRFDAAVHGPRLERLDWKSLSSGELLSVPPIVVLLSAQQLRRAPLGLLRSGRPIHVLIVDRPDGGAGTGYLAIAHREALVLQASPQRTELLYEGMERASVSLDPVVVIAAGSEAEVQSRSTPCFLYDPSGGPGWSERFRLSANPQPEACWPRYLVSYETEDGRPGSLEQRFTFAHAAALDRRWRSHFLLIEPSAWSEEQIDVADYLELPAREQARSLPFIWVIRDETLTRAVISRKLVFACRDRARRWRMLQELGGGQTIHTQRAAERARVEAEEQAERRVTRLEAEFAIALEQARDVGARGAVERLVRALVDPQGVHAEAMIKPPAMPPAPVADAPVVSEVPSIDSFLCTSCNECINLNSRLFRYNDDKQAEIADLSAGSYLQLVKAAEACPARCIHPGTPRAGDATATAAVIERAARFV